MAAPTEEKLIFDKFNLEALTVNQVKSSLLKSESSKCILDPPRVERRGTRIVTLG
jgi:hypothetical protein